MSLFLSFTTLSGCTQNTEKVDVEEKKEERIDTWSKDTQDESMTLMIYMTGSDLESGSGAASKDMEEMVNNKIDFSKVNVLVCTGGSQQWHTNIPNDSNSIQKLTENGFEQIETWKQESMGNPDTLTRFLDYGYKNYAADNYALILWNHGNGPLIGYGLDKQYDNDSLTLLEMESALKNSKFNEKNKLEFIGFDACLMASVEVACYISDYAKYLIASQEAEPNFGWNYDFLERCGKISSKSLGDKITDSYIRYCEDYFNQFELFKSDVTLSVMDLSVANSLREEINTLFKKASKDVSGDYVNLAKERIQTRALGRASTGSEYDLVDLKDLVNCMKPSYPKECEKIQTLLDEMILSNVSNTENVCGLSIYYPYYNKNYYTNSWKDTYSKLDLFPDYITYLSRYEKVWLGTNLKENYEEFTNPVIEKDGTYSLQLSEEQQEYYAKSGYYILRRTGKELYQPVFVSSNTTYENGKIQANFNGKVLYCKSYDMKIIPIFQEKDTVGDKTYYSCYPCVYDPNHMQDMVLLDVQLELDNTTEKVEIKNIVENDTKNKMKTGKRKPVNIADYPVLGFLNIGARYLTRDKNGGVKDFYDWEEGSWMTGHEMPANDPYEFTYEPMYDDEYEYFIMFRIWDVQNNLYSSELLPIDLAKAPKNETNILEKKANKNSNQVDIYKDNNISCSILMAQNYMSGQTVYYAKVDNQNDYKIQVDLKNLLVNNKYSDTEKYGIDVDAHSTTYVELDSIETICLNAGLDRLDTLQLRVSIQKNEKMDKQTIYPTQTIRCIFDEKQELESMWYPYMDALAKENQTLYEDKEIKITLTNAGYYLGNSKGGPSDFSSKMSFCCLLENKSKETKNFVFEGIKINDMYKEKKEYIKVEPGKKAVYILELTNSDIQGMGIQSIGRLDMCWSNQTLDEEDLVLNESDASWMAIDLSKKGKDEQLKPSKKNLLFENDQVAVYKNGFEWDEAQKKEYYWDLILVNKTDERLNISVERDLCKIDGKKLSDDTYFNNLTMIQIAPKEKAGMRIGVSLPDSIKEMECVLSSFISFGDDFEPIVFTLKSEE